ncbi:WXG100 family type VII secretion target [Nocardia sp. NPDC058640]|uniref:WXG100 family type VII secretion target n=1 Tax=Nocardia sp. NPDC058640 TaxID=3346571 RepID=UPI00365BCF78
MTTTTNFSAEIDGLDSEVARFVQRHDQIADAIKSLRTLEDEITTGSNWKGAARDAFNAFMERYYYQADKMNDQLMQTSENLRKMSGTLTDHDQAFSAQVNAQVSSLDLPAV